MLKTWKTKFLSKLVFKKIPEEIFFLGSCIIFHLLGSKQNKSRFFSNRFVKDFLFYPFESFRHLTTFQHKICWNHPQNNSYNTHLSTRYICIFIWHFKKKKTIKLVFVILFVMFLRNANHIFNFTPHLLVCPFVPFSTCFPICSFLVFSALLCATHPLSGFWCLCFNLFPFSTCS